MKYVYILRSESSSERIYTGLTSNLRKRLEYHNGGMCSHTSKFTPWKIIYIEKFPEDAEAYARERQIKRWSRAKKEALIVGDGERLKRLSVSKLK